MRLPRSSDPRAAWLAAAIAVVAASHACSDPERDRLKATTKPTYDTATGRLTELTFDANKNGRIDTWTEMDGNRPIRSRIDSDEDGRIDRWEYYDEKGKLLKVGYSASGGEKPDHWAYSDSSGRTERIESSSAADEKRIDKWERYANGQLATAEFDENADGRPDRRLTYKNGELVLIETAPDASGAYTRKVEPKG
jgi:hypothetical protein